MVDHSAMRLGKRSPRHDFRVPRLARYLKDTALPVPPAVLSYAGKLSTALGMMGNDSRGDCTCAAVGHAIQVWTSQASSEVTIADADVIALYERFGYNPANPATDQGAVETDVLTSWLNSPVAGHSISAFTWIDPANLAEVRDAIYLFGLVYIGIDLPTSAQSQDVWDVPSSGSSSGPGQPGSWGGHAVVVIGYDSGGLTCITWGALKRMTWAFWETYCDEAYGILSPDWKGAEGFDYAALTTDMVELKAGNGPPRSFSLPDRQLWMVQDALNSKIDSAAEDDGVVQSVDSAAIQKEWEALLAFFNIPQANKLRGDVPPAPGG